MIEGDITPAVGAVTCRTVRAKLAVMRIFLFMTGVAIGCQSFEYIVYMALRAWNIGVSAG